MDVILIVCFFYILLCCKPHREPDGVITAQRLLPIRGLCAAGIIFHHVSLDVGYCGTVLFQYFDIAGSLLVAVFFMISGYALAAQYARKREAYLSGFLKKRLSSLLLPYCLFALLYLILKGITGQDVSWRLAVLLPGNSSVVLYSWYVAAIAFLYVLFYLAHRVGGGRRWRFWLTLALGMGAYVLWCRVRGHGIWWYNSILAFPFGMVYYGLHRSGQPKKGKLAVIALSLLAFLGALVLRLKVFTEGLPGLAMDALVSLTFPWFVFSFLDCFQLRGRVLDYLGSRSYEIYLAQGIPITLLRTGLIPVSNAVLFWAVAFFGSILIGEAAYRIDRALLSRLRSAVPTK